VHLVCCCGEQAHPNSSVDDGLYFVHVLLKDVEEGVWAAEVGFEGSRELRWWSEGYVFRLGMVPLSR